MQPCRLLIGGMIAFPWNTILILRNGFRKYKNGMESCYIRFVTGIRIKLQTSTENLQNSGILEFFEENHKKERLC